MTNWRKIDVNFVNRGLALAVVGAGIAVIPTLGMQATAATKAEPSLLSQLRDQAQGSVAISKESATGKAGFVRSNGDLLPGTSASSASSAGAKADAYLDKYAAVLGARSAELEKVRVDSSPLGWTVTYTQAYQGIPVFGSGLKANLDTQGDLTSVSGYAAPDLNLSTSPRRNASEAGKAAVAIVEEFPPMADAERAADTTGLRASGAELVVYRKGSVKGETGEAVLAWQVDVSNVTKTSGTIHDVLFLDATSLKPVNRYSKIHTALDRELQTVTDDGNTPDDVSDDVRQRVWQEGDAFPGTLDQDQQNLLTSSAETYNLYRNLSGRDSYDGAGARMITVHNRSDRCPNASWNGEYASYCPGVYDDDTVAHEWSHAYTQYTSGLIYQWQSGALNESMSDVFGETVDLINAREDEGEGDLSVKRPDGLCSTHSPALPLLTIKSPASIAKECLTGGASFGRPLTGAGITGDVAVPTDPVEAGGTNLDGCSPYDQDVTGKIVLVNRGFCTFESKARVATAEGAAALIIGNREEAPLGMSGSDQTLVSTVSIGLSDRQSIRTAIAGGQTVNVNMRDVAGDRVDSYRWLLSEKSSAFGGAIRDMWNPTCHGDPGKVSDAEYKCGTDDAGGVHSNSGVPNHAFALAVDGGSYNGQTSTGLGLDKAVNLWWRAQSAYLTPTSDFVDLADGLEASCADLTGRAINRATLGTAVQPATPVTAADCAELAKVIAATELRTEPVQCNFQPLLNPAAPSLCGDGFVNEVSWSEDFEDGLAGWTASNQVVFAGGLNDPWRSSTVKGHAGKVAFGPAPDKGQCNGGAGDFSSRDSIASPVIEVGELLSPKLTFDHSVSTELGYDGGNVKISINGGSFVTIPAAAYLYNAPGVIATAGNTNPLKGQDGFTGTDGGTLESGWGTSVVDLAAMGLTSGDTVQMRFDIGRDGCGGVLGWSVDNVKIVDCKLPTTTVAVRTPNPTTFGTASSADITVSRNGSAGSAPTGSVTVTDASGKVLGTADLDTGGRATVALPANLPVGANRLTATYSGTRTLARSTAAFTATVLAVTVPVPTPGDKLTPRIATKMVKPVEVGTRVKLRVTVRARDIVPSGTVKIRLRGAGKSKTWTKTLNERGRTKVLLPKFRKTGTVRVRVAYSGDAATESLTKRIKFTVVDRRTVR